MSRQPKALPLTVICKTQPTVIEQDGSWIVVFVPDAPKSRRSARKSVKVATACKDVRTHGQANVPMSPGRDTKNAEMSAPRDMESAKCPHLGTSGGQTNVPLVFDDDHGAIRWAKKAISLGSKSRCFVELLWTQGVDHVVEVQDIEAAVFGIDGEDPQKMFVPRDTLKKFVRRLRKDLLEARFPTRLRRSKKILKIFLPYKLRGFGSN